MVFNTSRIISLAIAIAYAIGLAVMQGGVDFGVARSWIILIMPLALIWFPEELGSITGNVGRGSYITHETPGAFIAAMGWFFLVGFPVLLYVLRR
jgi:hypothetical protein